MGTLVYHQPKGDTYWWGHSDNVVCRECKTEDSAQRVTSETIEKIEKEIGETDDNQDKDK